jgi:hypothetical protein
MGLTEKVNPMLYAINKNEQSLPKDGAVVALALQLCSQVI